LTDEVVIFIPAMLGARYAYLVNSITPFVFKGCWSISFYEPDAFCPTNCIQEAQLPQRNSASAAHMQGLSPPVHSTSPLSGFTYAYGRIRNPQQTYAKRAVHKAHFKLNRAFKVIQGYPYLCRQEPRAVYCRNVQLMPPLFLKLTKMWQQEHSKFVDFNDPTQIGRRPSKKRLRISTNDLYCQKLESLAYIFAADSVGLHSLVFT